MLQCKGGYKDHSIFLSGIANDANAFSLWQILTEMPVFGSGEPCVRIDVASTFSDLYINHGGKENQKLWPNFRHHPM